MFQNPELCEEFPQLWNFTTGSVPFVQPTLIYVFNRSSHQKYDPTHPYIYLYIIYIVLILIFPQPSLGLFLKFVKNSNKNFSFLLMALK